MTDQPFEQMPLDTGLQIDRICKAFETARKSDSSVQIESFLNSSGVPAELERVLLVELIETEREILSREGTPVSQDAYVSRFPEYRNAIESTAHFPVNANEPVAEPDSAADAPCLFCRDE